MSEAESIIDEIKAIRQETSDIEHFLLEFKYSKPFAEKKIRWTNWVWGNKVELPQPILTELKLLLRKRITENTKTMNRLQKKLKVQ